MRGKFIQANATRKNLAELLLQPKSLCHKYRSKSAMTPEEDALMAQR